MHQRQHCVCRCLTFVYVLQIPCLAFVSVFRDPIRVVDCIQRNTKSPFTLIDLQGVDDAGTLPSIEWLMPFLTAHPTGADTHHDHEPFRPERSSISPVIINALVQVLFHHAEAASAVATLLKQRAATDDWRLCEDEEQMVKARVCGVVNNAAELRFMLATAVERTLFISKYGMQSEYGISDNLEGDPLEQMNHVECLLALYMLHKEETQDGEKMVTEIDFLDAEKLKVLQGAAP